MSRNPSISSAAGPTAGATFFVIPEPTDRSSRINTNGNPTPSTAGCLAGAAQQNEHTEAFIDMRRDFDNPRYTG